MHKPLVLDPDALCDDGTLCLLAQIAPGTLSRARKAGTLRYTRQGNRILYRGSWVLSWLESEAKGGEEVTNE